ncbi:MAG TPA: hypothetical protein VLD37_00405 [Candidatus Bilamarchaeum sp.]|nr:hypothetical protein [Candidatus Bilamarchaeum sp.]
MQPEIQITREKKMFTRTITGIASFRPEFKEFKDLPALDSVRLGTRKGVAPEISVKVTAEKGFFSTTYTVYANFMGTMPLSNKFGGSLTGFADVSKLSVTYYDAEGERAGTVNRENTPMEKPRGISQALGDDYRLGIEGNLDAVISLISSVPIFSLPALQVIKAVAAEAGELKVVKQ